MNLTITSNRRTFLRNGTKALTLPFLSSLLPSSVQAATEKELAKNSVRRLLWMSMGHGHMEKHFYPSESGSLNDLALPAGWDPMKKNLGHVTMVSNFTNAENKQPHEGSEAVLTCANVVGFSGKGAAQQHFLRSGGCTVSGEGGRAMKAFSSIARTVDSGNGHGGVAISYREDGSPLPGFASPLEVFFKIFWRGCQPGGNAAHAQATSQHLRYPGVRRQFDRNAC